MISLVPLFQRKTIYNFILYGNLHNPATNSSTQRVSVSSNGNLVADTNPWVASGAIPVSAGEWFSIGGSAVPDATQRIIGFYNSSTNTTATDKVLAAGMITIPGGYKFQVPATAGITHMRINLIATVVGPTHTQLGELQLNYGETLDPYTPYIAHANLNLKTIYESEYPPAINGDKVTITVSKSVTAYSTNASSPTIDCGSWPAGVETNILLLNEVLGAGGDGSGPNPAQQGGTALKVRTPINLSYFKIAGGGGGGAGTDAWPGSGGGSGTTYQAGGGGGAGSRAGFGKTSSTGPSPIAQGSDGTRTTGGQGGSFGSDPTQPSKAGGGGGDGGNLGMPGQAAGDVSQPGSEDNIGGAAGFSIDGMSFVTVVSSGTLIGPTNP